MRRFINIRFFFVMLFCLTCSVASAQYDEGGDDWDYDDVDIELDEFCLNCDDYDNDDDDDDDDDDDNDDDDWWEDEDWEDEDWEDDDDWNDDNNEDDNNNCVDCNQWVSLNILAVVTPIKVKVEPLKITIAPITNVVTSLTATQLADLISKYNTITPNNPVSAATTLAQANAVNVSNTAIISPQVQAFLSWLQNSILTAYMADVNDSNTVIEFEGCDNECHCTSEVVCEKMWYLDNDGDGYHSEVEEAENPPGDNWKETTSGEDCDDEDPNRHKDCSKPKCEKRTGLLHDANFEDNMPTLGINITTKEDNFRNDSWGIINVNCGTGKIPKDSRVYVTSITPVVRTLASGAKLNYYNVEYEDCEKGNNKVNPGFDENKPCSDCFKGNPVKGDAKIAKQLASGIGGGLFGDNYRKKWATDENGKKLKNSEGKNYLVPKNHNGIDIFRPKGDFVFSMFDGEVLDHGKTKKGGYFIRVLSKINGDFIQVTYYHMKNEGRIPKGTIVKAGDKIAIQGDSGNLKQAIANKLTESHTHISLQKNWVATNPLEYMKYNLNPETGKLTETSDCK